VTVEVTGVESPTKGGTTFGVVAVCANTTSCALEQIVAAATRIATIKRRKISSAGSEKFRRHHSGTAPSIAAAHYCPPGETAREDLSFRW
jgi:hypothetical protein